MARRIDAALRGALVSAMVVLASCASEELTQLMVVVDTDFEVPVELDEVEITVTGPDAIAYTSSGVVDADRLPMQLAVVHRGGPLGPVRVKVQGTLAGAPVVQRRAVVWFVEGEVRLLRMDLLRSCQGVSCPTDSCGEAECTCADGECRARRVTEDELPVYMEPMRLDGGTPDTGPVDMQVDACVTVEEVCNGMDDDCDGAIDELFDLQSDMRHCGSCGNECDPDPTRGSSSCVAGSCVLICDDGFADCNGDEGDGCEADLASAGSCGSCDRQCTGATPVCDADVCAADCPVGTTLCGGDTCADLTTSTSNCGTCGNVCAGAANALPTCTDGGCGVRCDAGFFECDGLRTTGCESRLRELANCGACGATCAGTAAITSCATGACEVIGCDPGFEDCDGEPMNGCEANLAGDPTTCGSCTNVCPIDPANGAPVCDMGRCGVACDPGYRDCDGDLANGCEAFEGDVESCGGCGILCDGATPVCGSSPTGYSCIASCGAGLMSCNGGTICADLTNDVRHCGACGTTCPDPMRASPTCTGGTCGFTCDPGFGNCDSDPTNGCEANFASTSDCGGCGMVCASASDATIGCVSGSCAITGCTGTTQDCDGTYANGCEVDLGDDPANCGSCGRTCTPGNHVDEVGCTDRACVVVTCEAGFADCDGDFATGCEANLANRRTCGACDVDCGGGPDGRCCGGTCGGC